MKLGILARCDNSGLGNQTWEIFNHLPFNKVMLIEIADSRGHNYRERYNREGVEVMNVGSAPTFEEAKEFLKDIDLVFIAETPYSYHFLKLARQMGVATLVQPNYELCPWIINPNLVKPDVFGIPSKWHFDEFPKPNIFLPLPIATERFAVNEADSARKFLHVTGRPAANDRNGTRDLVEALPYIKSHIQLTIQSMPIATGADNYVEAMLLGRKIPPNVRLIVSRIAPDNYWDLYPGHDVLIMPRRYGGQSLTVNEAIGHHMPVIMPDISPNNQWLPKNWLTKAELDFHFKPGRHGVGVDVYKTDPKDLAAKIDQFVEDPVFYGIAKKDAIELSGQYSWGALKPLYLDTFQTIINS